MDNDLAYGYVIYRFNEGEKIQTDDPRNIINISFDAATTFVDNTITRPGKYIYIITAIDRIKNESLNSNPAPVEVRY